MIPLSKIAEIATSRGHTPAVIHPSGVLTWDDLVREVPKVIHGLLDVVEQSELATICFIARNRAELVLCAAAAATLKVSFCGLDYSQPSEKLAQMVASAGANCLIVSSRLIHEQALDVHRIAGRLRVIDLDGMMPNTTSFKDLLNHEGSPVPAPIKRPFRAISFTSGTSGQPKAVIRTASFDARRFTYFATRYGFSAADRHLVTIPLYHATGNGWARLFLSLGATLVLAPPDDPRAAADLIRTEWVTTAAMTPPTLMEILHQAQSGGKRLQPNCLKFVLVGGKNFNANAKRTALKVLGAVVHGYYGTTETGVNTIAEPDDILVVQSRHLMDWIENESIRL